MAKNIVFCADGTWNGTGGPDEIADTSPSNVLKLFWLLTGSVQPGAVQNSEIEITAPATDTQPEQRAKYLHGVGDSSNTLAKLAQGSLGLGLISRVLRGYTYLSRNYVAGDAVYITGFSRGAYTARALGGLITEVGLLDWNGLGLNPDTSDDEGYKYAAAAWTAYQHSIVSDSQRTSLLGRIETCFADAPDFLSWLAYRPKYVADRSIKAIGVWDTVGALGIPEIDQSDTVRLDLLRFADTSLSPKVEFGFHAISADEQRVDFSPTLWDSRDGVAQHFFSGAHSDVGGSYPIDGNESNLSDISLKWMQEQFRGAGMAFKNDAIVNPGYELGPMHAPWLETDFFKRPTAPRTFPVSTSSQITCNPSVNAHLGKPVVTINPNSSALNVTGPYVPIALIQAGYVTATFK